MLFFQCGMENIQILCCFTPERMPLTAGLNFKQHQLYEYGNHFFFRNEIFKLLFQKNELKCGRFLYIEFHSEADIKG